MKYLLSLITLLLGMTCQARVAVWPLLTLAMGGDALCTAFYEADPPLKGDLDGDGKLAVNDVTLLVAHILGEQEMADKSIGDLNEDQKNNVADVMLLVNIILNADDGDSPHTQDDDANPEVPVLAPRHP